MSETPGMEDVVVRGCTLKRDIGRVTLVGLPNAPGVAAGLFDALAARRVVVDDIVQTIAPGGKEATISFTVEGRDIGEAQAVGELVRSRHPGAEIAIDTGLARLSVVGVGMRSHSGVAARMFAALSAERINIENISTSEIVISALLQGADGERGLQAVHRAFDLDRPGGDRPGASGAATAGAR